MLLLNRSRPELIRAARGLGAPDDVRSVGSSAPGNFARDWATNLAMVLAKPLKAAPREIAERLRDSMRLESAGVVEIDIAGPGFMNFWIDAGRIASVPLFSSRRTRATAPVRSGWQSGQRRVVSANPRGRFMSATPSGRARRCDLDFARGHGLNVTREFYYNDAGAQIENLPRASSKT